MAPKPQLQDDPNTFIPPAVRKQAQAADAAFRAARGDPPQEAAAANAAPPGAEAPSPGAAPPPPPAAEVAPPAFSPGAAPLPTPTPLFGEQPLPSSPPAEAAPPPVEDWERRYKGMEGRYKRAETDIINMSGQLASMQNLIATLQRPVSSETPAELRPQSLLTPEEVGEYGTEFLSVVARKAKEELSPEFITLKNQITTLEKRLQGTTEQQNERARLEMEATLDRALPQWRDINMMQDFHAWLALPDQYSGAIKHNLLRAAYAQNNSPRVLAFFKGFLDQEAALVPQGGEPHLAPAAATMNGSDKIPLESFAAPGRAKTSAASVAPVEKPIITRAQIAQFFAESTAGKYRGREAEKDRLEGMIFEAQREGRIR